MAYYKKNYSGGYRKPQYSPSRPGISTSAQVSHSDPTARKWQAILNYYLECISLENSGATELDSAKEGTEFVGIPSSLGKEWLSSGKENLVLTGLAGKLEELARPSRFSKSNPSYFYGFPCYAKTVPALGRNHGGYSLKPILIFPVELTTNAGERVISLTDEKPRINSAFLTDASLLTSVEERKKAAEVLLESWDDQKTISQNLNQILIALKEFLAEVVPFDPRVLTGELESVASVKLTENSIQPLAVVFKSAESKYTWGLENELRQLRNTSVPNPVFNALIKREEVVIEEPQDNTLIEISPLNDEQRVAVKSAFTNKITVVTGPPGTGKSQVVLNIVANAVMKGQTVLFASKNHKAVDVVIDRLNNIQHRPIILKYGNRANEADFAANLLQAAQDAARHNQSELNREYAQRLETLGRISDEITGKETILEENLKLRNAITELDRELEELSDRLPKELRLHKINTHAELPSAFTEKSAGLKKAFDWRESLPPFSGTILAWFGFSPEKRILKAGTELLAAFPVPLENIQVSNISDAKELYSTAELFSEYSQKLTRIQKLLLKADKLVGVDNLRERLLAGQKALVLASIELLDSALKKRLAGLSSTQRTKIADYANIVRSLQLDTLGGTGTEDLKKEKGKIQAEVVKCFPTIAVTNLSVRRVLPLSSELVDMVVIDEASQCDIASAIPLIYRAKRAIVIGDAKQLIHISELPKTDDQQLQRRLGLTAGEDQRFLYSLNSLFDLFSTLIGSGAKYVHLLDHYRSRSEIIEYSNSQFYQKNLSVWTDYRDLKTSGLGKAVAWHDVVGEVVRPSAGSACNHSEAESVCTLISKILEHPGILTTKPSIGVVTPFREQANIIRRLMQQSTKASSLNAIEFAVDTAHKFQGDEKDIMIFSPVVSRRIPERTLGFLSSTANLFNVAITRARSELHVVGDHQACLNSKIPHLVNFVKYVDSLGEKEHAESYGIFESPWEKTFHDALLQEGIKTLPQYSFQQYRLDLAILNDGKRLDLEIDGEHWHRELDGSRLKADLKRDRHLTINGWTVKRFWVYQLKNSMTNCVNEVKRLLTT